MIQIVTPCSRPENLLKIKDSIINSVPLEKLHEYNWSIIVDKNVNYNQHRLLFLRLQDKCQLNIDVLRSPIANSLAGHSHRNYFLNLISDQPHRSKVDFVYFLDDDTVLHENFHKFVFDELKEEVTAIVFNQLFADGFPRLFAAQSNIKVCHIDMGQYVVNLNKIPNFHRFEETDYCADGIFIEKLFNESQQKDSFKIVNQFCSIYNALRP